jgi:hypothetical protein
LLGQVPVAFEGGRGEKRKMENGAEGEDEAETQAAWCVVLFDALGAWRSGKAAQTSDEPVSSVLDKLRKLANAKHVQVACHESAQRSHQMAATRYLQQTPPDKAAAAVSVHMAMECRARANGERARYANVMTLINAITEARRALSTALLLQDASVTMGQLIDASPDVARVMATVREQMQHVQSTSTELERPLSASSELAAEGARLAIEEEVAELLAQSLPSLPATSLPVAERRLRKAFEPQ